MYKPQKIKSMNETINKKNNFEDILDESLRSYGYLFPETDKQMTILEQNIELTDLPEKFASVDFIFEAKEPLQFHKFNKLENPVEESYCAMAARECIILPEDILEKMKKDKIKVKKEIDGIK